MSASDREERAAAKQKGPFVPSLRLSLSALRPLFPIESLHVPTARRRAAAAAASPAVGPDGIRLELTDFFLARFWCIRARTNAGASARGRKGAEDGPLRDAARSMRRAKAHPLMGFSTGSDHPRARALHGPAGTATALEACEGEHVALMDCFVSKTLFTSCSKQKQAFWDCYRRERVRDVERALVERALGERERVRGASEREERGRG